MSDKETVYTPNPAKSVKFANPSQEGAQFPAFNSRCSVQKGLLTKALNSVKSSRIYFGARLLGDFLGDQRKGPTIGELLRATPGIVTNKTSWENRGEARELYPTAEVFRMYEGRSGVSNELETYEGRRNIGVHKDRNR